MAAGDHQAGDSLADGIISDGRAGDVAAVDRPVSEIRHGGHGGSHDSWRAGTVVPGQRHCITRMYRARLIQILEKTSGIDVTNAISHRVRQATGTAGPEADAADGHEVLNGNGFGVAVHSASIFAYRPNSSLEISPTGEISRLASYQAYGAPVSRNAGSGKGRPRGAPVGPLRAWCHRPWH